ncbi:ATP-grasp domain-containing protein [Saccharothrix coeruleofusca]|uniref:ATP-grasp domain-containing protein n=1 Tax=Saccharothrix coeruleofusca TaxID=33919 RepID=A0A918EI38_9PSEU|nr:hypothetical protein [Saccharothrix coeruleofusca]GGP81463.1 hypothetical protein GCM10010185_64280 [Saccharothrix coeruleofusca]
MNVEPTGPPSCRLLLCLPSLPFARKAARCGLDLWLVVDQAQHAVFTLLTADRTTPVDSHDEVAVADAVTEVVRRNGITHVLDAEGVPAAGVTGAEDLEAVRVLADDYRLEQVLAPSHHPMVRTRTVADAADVPKAVADIGPPAVIRSADREAVVRSEVELDEWVRRLGDGQGPFAVGEFVAGPQVVVTTLTHDGMHRVVGITARQVAAHGVRYLHPAVLDEPEAKRVRATVTAMLDLVGYEFGPAQTRVVLSDHGPRIVRSRPGFGHREIRRLIEVTSGFDVQTELFRALAGVPVHPPLARWFAGVEFFRLPGAEPPCDQDGTSGPRVLAEGPTAELVAERLDLARHRLWS